MQGLRSPLTLIIAPAGFGKTTLVAFCVYGCGMTVAWRSLDKYDNQAGRFLNYMVAALREVDNTIGNEAAQLLAGMQQVTPEVVLTTLINERLFANDLSGELSAQLREISTRRGWYLDPPGAALCQAGTTGRPQARPESVSAMFGFTPGLSS